ncbi:MAG: hypothetical protein U9R38_00465 [Candidatus Margulisiibacteriota bacterium]|nr:hypothetical protein [Candidatus Margulisiibacteriota bacterium]
MPKLINLLNENKMTLMVALPKNDKAMAEAAIAGGVDALQLHINTSYFKTFYEEKDDLVKIVKDSVIPVGIVPGQEVHADEDEMEEIKKLGFDFFNIDANIVPPFMVKLKGISRVLALNSKYTLDTLMQSLVKKPEAIDAAIVPAAGKGKHLIVGDLQHYISVVLSAGVPVIVPTQRQIRPSEVAIISDTGAKGLMLTSIVTGDTPSKVEKTVREFRAAVDDLGD